MIRPCTSATTRPALWIVSGLWAMNDARQKLNDDWADFKKQQQQYYDQRDQSRAEARELHEQWRTHQEEKRERLCETRERTQSKLDHCYEQRSKLSDMSYSARSDDHRCRVDGWIDDNERKISNFENAVEDLSDKIRDIDDKLQS